MGSVTSVILALNAAGIRADRAYPSRKLPNIGKAAAAVMLESRDYSANTDVVRVVICSPSILGGSICEDAAKSAGEVLANMKRSGWKTVCTQDACTFDGASDQYQVAIKVIFTPERVTVSQNGTVLEGTVAFEAWKKADAEKAITLDNAPWQIRLEEMILGSIKEVSWESDGFRLMVNRESGMETFENCSWNVVERLDTPEGLKQIRIGTAGSRSYAPK